MSGVKGRSGKATTLEAKLAKAEGGRKSGGGRTPSALPPPDPSLDPTSDDPVARLGKPLTWGDELKRAQVEGERTQNRRRAVEVERAEVELQRARDEAAQARGALVERTEMTRAVALIRDAWWKSAQKITSDTLAALPGLPVEARDLIRKAADAAVASAAERVKADLT